MSKWEQTREVFERAHDDLFSDSRYSAEFFNYTVGTRSNLDDEFTGETRSSIGTAQVEMVPPSMDTTIRTEGTTFSWDTSIRLPEDEDLIAELVPLGEDNRKPTEVDILNEKDDTQERYELHGYSTEKGSGFIMCRLTEQ